MTTLTTTKLAADQKELQKTARYKQAKHHTGHQETANNTATANFPANHPATGHTQKATATPTRQHKTTNPFTTAQVNNH